MTIKEFNEICEIAYTVRTDNQKQNGTFDWWVTGENANDYKFEKKPLQRAYLIFTKKGTFKRDEAYAGRDDMRHAAESFEGFIDGHPSEHDFDAAVASLHSADAGAKKAARAYRNMAERMVFAPAFVLDVIRPLSFRLETIFDPLVEEFLYAEYNEENIEKLRDGFNAVYDRDENDEGAWQTEDDMYVEARRLHNGHNWPLYFLNSEYEDKYKQSWTAQDLRDNFINSVDRLHTLGNRAVALAENADDGGKWERAKQEIATVEDFIDSSQMYGAAKTLANRTVSSDSSKRSTLYAAWQQMIEARDYWRDALEVANTKKNAPDGKDTLVGACEVAVEKLSLVRSARYKIHLAGKTPFLNSWVVNQAKKY